MKKYFKETYPSYMLAFALCFMLFIYEPILFYSNNLNDLWFDLGILVKETSVLFFIGLVITLAVLNISYFINKKFYKIIYLITFVCFIYSYIQGNYLVGGLPILDGTPINWNLYKFQNIISIVLLVLAIISAILMYIKVKDVKKYTFFASLAVVIMLSTSLLSTLLTTDALKEKDVIISTTFDNMNIYSSDKNFIILLLDATDSRYFAKAINDNKEFKHILDDFTYYPDTLSGHPFTMESIPYILTGERYENQEKFSVWETNALKNSYLLNTLYDKGYELNLYDRDIIYNDKSALRISNAVDMNGTNTIETKKFIKEEMKYILFRYLPYPLKKYSKIENMNLGLSKISQNTNKEYFYESNFEFLDRTRSELFEQTMTKQFKYFHLDGAHIPFTFNKELETVIDGDYMDEVEGECNIVKKYLDMLKENNVYDNSNIIILADHGYNVDASIYGRQNPILYIKGVNEKHDKMLISDKQVSFADLNDAYKELMEEKKSSELFANVNNNRTRKYLLYVNDEKNMVEYETKGKAWETDKMTKTGMEYPAR